VTVAIDINVLLDVFLHRLPHYAASAQVVNHIVSGTLTGNWLHLHRHKEHGTLHRFFSTRHHTD
jgi:hypothetical protein